MAVTEDGTRLIGSSNRVAVTTTGSMRIHSWPKATGEKEDKMKNPKRGRIFIERRRTSRRREMG
jgi:hypothetical protein